MISKYILDNKQFNDTNVYVIWKNCSLRKWLNKEFLNAAFSASEIKKLEMITIRDDIWSEACCCSEY